MEVAGMMTKLVNAVFGCRHSNYSFPITTKLALRRTGAAAVTGTYVVCLDCGTELPYDWSEMHVTEIGAKAFADKRRALASAKQAA